MAACWKLLLAYVLAPAAADDSRNLRSGMSACTCSCCRSQPSSSLTALRAGSSSETSVQTSACVQVVRKTMPCPSTCEDIAAEDFAGIEGVKDDDNLGVVVYSNFCTSACSSKPSLKMASGSPCKQISADNRFADAANSEAKANMSSKFVALGEEASSDATQKAIAWLKANAADEKKIDEDTLKELSRTKTSWAKAMVEDGKPDQKDTAEEPKLKEVTTEHSKMREVAPDSLHEEGAPKVLKAPAAAQANKLHAHKKRPPPVISFVQHHVDNAHFRGMRS
eukprot:TRINITY_DN56874_c0_g1_i1.p1 TRINITY_DN56874_c0_g1~~TRINITY_DN56874_c0_g1_i1.p1  ORF type:complete len:280 (+),score=60.60 TRINITY_DN56874_c0_g1_i1:96-935(+)